ncbi:MAG: DUF6603 domain-containing protein [Pseudomonadota bacterium]
MTVTFEDIKTRLKELQDAYAKDLAGVFEITTDPKQIELKKPLPLAKLEHFFATLFGEGDTMPDLPLGGATIEQLLIHGSSETDVFTAKLRMSFSTATWPVMDGLELELKTLQFENLAGHWSGSVAASAKALDREFDVSLSWPEMIIEGHLSEDTALKKAREDIRKADTTAELTKAQAAFDAAIAGSFAKDDTVGLMGAHALTADPGAHLDRLDIYAAPRIQYLRFGIAGSNLVKFHELTVKTAELELIYAGAGKTRFTGSLDALIALAKTKFHLTAARTETGWTARASASSRVKVSTMVEEVSKELFGISHSPKDFGVPDDLANKDIEGEVVLKLDTAKSAATLSLTAKLDTGRIDFSFAIAKKGLTVKGKLTLGDLEFEVGFSNNNKAKQPVLAAQFKGERGVTLKLEDLAKMTSLSTSGTPPTVDASLSVTLKDALLAGTKPGTETHYLLAADLEGGVDLTGLGDLPLVGSLMPQDLAFELALAPILAHGKWSKADVKALNDLRGKGGPTLPEKIDGPSLRASFKSPGHAPEEIDLPLESDVSTPGSTVKPKPPAPGDEALKWKDLQRKFGPVSLKRVGVGLDRKSGPEPRLAIAMDGGLSIAGLDLELIGLGAHYGLNSKDLEFDLKGLGLEFNKDPIKIAGAFANMGDGFLGKATLGTKSFTLSAMGGFAMIEDQPGHKTPSMFLYGVLNTPLGGPAFFFVEGLAAGFGYNRRFTGPKLSEIREFPFVKDAVGASKGKKRKAPASKSDIGKELELLHKYITPELGQYFAAVGVKFTSFKLLDSFVLLVVSFGREVDIKVLGVSTYQMPPIVPAGTPAMARIELNLDADYRPKSGELKVRAELGRNSYVYASLCHLSGGFAFYSWFGPKNAGDFVLSAGGYHPDFKKPAHYPSVKRISLTYQISSDIYVKGSAYFALTPSMFMAGGSLSASAKFGKVSASFKMTVNMMVAWEPYHYTADASLDIRAKWWKFSTHAYAKLSIWGPSFSGSATVHWSVVSFDVSFGHAWRFPKFIDFNHFCKSFLPHDTGSSAPNIAPSIAVSKGMIEEHALKSAPKDTNETQPIINPHGLEIRVDTAVPFQTWNTKKIGSMPTLGCAPLGRSSLKDADLSYAIEDAQGNDAAAHFKVKHFVKPVPPAMWGRSMTPSVKKTDMIDATGGITLTLAKAPRKPKPQEIHRRDCAYDISPDTKLASHVSGRAPAPKIALGPNQTRQHVAKALEAKATAQAEKNRNDVFASLGLSPTTDGPSENVAQTYRVAPVVVRIS